MCTFGLSGCRVKPRRGFTPPKRGREKLEILGLSGPNFRPPILQAPIFLGWAPTLSAPTHPFDHKPTRAMASRHGPWPADTGHGQPTRAVSSQPWPHGPWPAHTGRGQPTRAVASPHWAVASPHGPWPAHMGTWYSVVNEQTCTIDHKMDHSMWQTPESIDILHSSHMWLQIILPGV